MFNALGNVILFYFFFRLKYEIFDHKKIVPSLFCQIIE